MTRAEPHIKKTEYAKNGRVGSRAKGKIAGSQSTVWAALMCGFILFLLLKNPSVATASLKKGLSLCGGSLIPSLFPFMIVSELTVKSGLASYPARLLDTPSRKLFGISGEGGCALLVGTLCGFPIGARMGMSLYEQGKISSEELQRLVSVSSNPGLAFTVMTLGRDRFGSIKLGIILYSAVVLSAIAVGFLAKSAFPISQKIPPPASKELRAKSPSAALLLTESVRSSSLAMLYVCGFVTFFSTVSGALGAIIETYFSLSERNISLIFGTLELTGGLFSLPITPHSSAFLASAGAMLGFSGLSVHFQILSVCNGKNEDTLRYLPLFIAKLLSAAVSALLLLAFSKFLL